MITMLPATYQSQLAAESRAWGNHLRSDEAKRFIEAIYTVEDALIQVSLLSGDFRLRVERQRPG